MPQVSAAMDKAQGHISSGIQYASSSALPLLLWQGFIARSQVQNTRKGMVLYARQPDDKAKSCFDYAGCRSFVLVGAYTMGGEMRRDEQWKRRQTGRRKRLQSTVEVSKMKRNNEIRQKMLLPFIVSCLINGCVLIKPQAANVGCSAMLQILLYQ